VTLRFDPRDMGEIRAFHEDGFLCRAVSAELAGQTVPLREIMRARNRPRRDLRAVIRERLLQVASRRVHRDGIHFRGFRYHAAMTSAYGMPSATASSKNRCKRSNTSAAHVPGRLVAG
jgi:hypothetical protein